MRKLKSIMIQVLCFACLILFSMCNKKRDNYFNEEIKPLQDEILSESFLYQITEFDDEYTGTFELKTFPVLKQLLKNAKKLEPSDINSEEKIELWSCISDGMFTAKFLVEEHIKTTALSEENTRLNRSYIKLTELTTKATDISIRLKHPF
jgi:hypothetical protein